MTMKYALGAALCLLLFACNTTVVQSTSKETHDVIGVSNAMLTVDFWLAEYNQATPLMSAQQIQQFNQQLIENNQYVVEPLATPQNLTKSELLNFIDKVSTASSSSRFYADGRQLTAEHYQTYVAALNKMAVKESNTTRYGLVVNRTSLRKFPTYDRVFNQAMDTDIDRFQESALFPGQAVAVLHQSHDQQWYLVQSYHYLAWVNALDIAIGERGMVADFINANHFLVVTGDKIFTNFNPEFKQLSEKQLDMGVRLPLVDTSTLPNSLYGQNPYASYTVLMPYRLDDGSLAIKPSLIARNQDVHIGYLAYNTQNIIKQAFKFLGERYGWGHDFNARDCTGFVGEIYKTFGLLMPRNSGEQGKSQYGISLDFADNDEQYAKQKAISELAVGDLIYIPGHVMMYLGKYNNEPYVIHDVKGLGYLNNSNEFYQGTLSGVSITPLMPLMLTAQKSYVDKIYNIKRIR